MTANWGLLQCCSHTYLWAISYWIGWQKGRMESCLLNVTESIYCIAFWPYESDLMKDAEIIPTLERNLWNCAELFLCSESKTLERRLSSTKVIKRVTTIEKDWMFFLYKMTNIKKWKGRFSRLSKVSRFSRLSKFLKYLKLLWKL